MNKNLKKRLEVKSLLAQVSKFFSQSCDEIFHSKNYIKRNKKMNTLLQKPDLNTLLYYKNCYVSK